LASSKDSSGDANLQSPSLDFDDDSAIQLALVEAITGALVIVIVTMMPKMYNLA
jgi:hypothetical protein